MEWLKQQFRRKEEGFIFHKKNKGGTFLRLKNYKINPSVRKRQRDLLKQTLIITMLFKTIKIIFWCNFFPTGNTNGF